MPDQPDQPEQSDQHNQDDQHDLADRQAADRLARARTVLQKEMVRENTAAAGAPAADTAAKLQPLFPDVHSWVCGVFAVTFVRRATSTFRWCPQWWRHPEAIVRLEALWRSWELLRLDPTIGAGTWFAQHLDHQLPILTSAAGPFADCDPSGHYDPESPSLPVEPAPPGWWGPTPAPATPAKP